MMDPQMDISPTSGFPYPVYTGLWTNWSYGRAMGSTLTLGRANANLLIGAVTFFMTIVATHIWRIICFSLHAYYSDSSPRDGLYHQRQAIIRNSSSAAGSFLTFINLVWSWRKLTRSSLRLLPVLLLTLLIAVGLAAASVFASRVATGSEVLLAGSNCGIVVPDFSDPSLAEIFTDYTPYLADSLTQAATYASQCYEGSASSSMGCGVFVKPQLKPAIMNPNAECPFSNMCKSNDSNLLIDTGLLNSNDDLGINTPEDERFLFRMAVTCAPLKTDGYARKFNVSRDRSYTQYFYGEGANNDFTFEASNDAVYEEIVSNISSFAADYQLGVNAVSLYNGSPAVPPSSFQPIPEILGFDRDVFLVFQSAGGVLFMNKTLDPWYQATTPISLRFLSGQARVEAYTQDEAGSTLACTYQEQYCNPPFDREDSCTNLGPSLDSRQQFLESSLGSPATERADWSVSAAQNLEPNPMDVVSTLGPQSLVSRRTLIQGQQGYLPEDQWKSDVQHWFDISLAALQNAYVKTAAGPPPSIPEAAIKRPATDQERMLCGNQKVISTDYVSFSFFGLMIILILGLIIIFIAFLLECLASRIQKRFKFPAYRRLEWVANGTLQLQRLAHEELGTGEWTDCDESIPVTKRLDNLALLDVTDERHPRLIPQTRSISGHESETSQQVNSTDSDSKTVKRRSESATDKDFHSIPGPKLGPVSPTTPENMDSRLIDEESACDGDSIGELRDTREVAHRTSAESLRDP